MTSDDTNPKLRELPADYPEQALERVRKFFGLTEEEFRAEFKRMRRPYDDPRRTPSKRRLLEQIRQVCEAEGIPLYPGDERQD